jgi:hypothetical protein
MARARTSDDMVSDPFGSCVPTRHDFAAASRPTHLHLPSQVFLMCVEQAATVPRAARLGFVATN